MKLPVRLPSYLLKFKQGYLSCFYQEFWYKTKVTIEYLNLNGIVYDVTNEITCEVTKLPIKIKTRFFILFLFIYLV